MYFIHDGDRERRFLKDNPRSWAHKTIPAARFSFIQRKNAQYNIVKQQLQEMEIILQTLAHDWGMETEHMPSHQTIERVYEAELKIQNQEDLFDTGTDAP